VSAPDPTGDFVTLQAADPGLLTCVRDMQLPGAGAHYPKIALPRPIFTPRSEVTALTDDVLSLLDIFRSLPERCFGGDWDRYLTAQGFAADEIALQRAGLTHEFIPLGRIDAFPDAGTLKIMEINIGSGIGGMGVAKLCRGLLRDPRFREFAEKHALSYDDPVEAMARALRRIGKEVVGTDDPRVALVEDSHGTTSYGRSISEDLTKLGLSVVPCSVDDLVQRAGKIVSAGQPIDVAVRFFVLHDLTLGYARREQIEMLAQAHRAGRTALYLGLDSEAHSDKGSLALVHDPDVQLELTPGERAIVERRVPWTRVLRSTDHDLVEEARARRTDLVVKPVSSFHGEGVLLGSETSEADWHDAMGAPDGTHVVQQRLHPTPEIVLDPDTAEPEDWNVNLGVYFGPDGYEGTWVRARPTADGGIVGMNERTKPGCAFTY
jgi:hypothetical protein